MPCESSSPLPSQPNPYWVLDDLAVSPHKVDLARAWMSSKGFSGTAVGTVKEWKAEG